MQAQYKAEIDKAQAEAAQAGPLAQANAQRAVIAAQTELAQRQAELRQQQLVAEVVKPAEAEAERIRILALADAERTRIQAEAAASNDRVALDRLIIDQLPLIVKEAAAGLAGANINVLNGADGLSEIAAGLVGQGLTILGLGPQGHARAAPGQRRQRARGERPGFALAAWTESEDLLTSWQVRRQPEPPWLGSKSWQQRPPPSRMYPGRNSPRHRQAIAGRWRWPPCTTCWARWPSRSGCGVTRRPGR